MNQDLYAIKHLWLVTAAMSILGSYVLIETTTLIKVLLAVVSLVITSSAPAALELEALEYVIHRVYLLIITLISWVASWQVEMGRREAFDRRLGVEIGRERTVDLLRNILPESIANYSANQEPLQSTTKKLRCRLRTLLNLLRGRQPKNHKK